MHDSVQTHTAGIQLRLQGGQRFGLLPAQRSSRSADNHHHCTFLLPKVSCLDFFFESMFSSIVSARYGSVARFAGIHSLVGRLARTARPATKTGVAFSNITNQPPNSIFGYSMNFSSAVITPQNAYQSHTCLLQTTCIFYPLVSCVPGNTLSQ
ncbi:hypothetical protein NP493_454g03031 [Ridgeia piscesae]|uniref:Uncharacterized protein n=1 Tax=Ridgeia piscesae TaxID=27915 RepID=A0AAD9KZ03_RIDPI|nr:hypothetical protein NP493_454g03031 [Ridgeia piscesae]